MGTFSVPIEIGNPDGTQYETIRALVGTGANYTTVPAPLLRELGVPVHDQVTFILADDRRIRRDVGRTWIRIDGRSEITLVVFGDEDTEALLGAYTMQGLLMNVDAANERLIQVPRFAEVARSLLRSPFDNGILSPW